MNIQRDAALILLSTLKAAQLNSSEKEEILDEYRFSNYDTPQFCKENYKELLQNLEISKGGSSEFTGLFIDHFQPQFKGISNAYLSMLLQNFGIYNLVVVGDEDGVQACPCCGFKTIENLGHYEICPVCNWEDDGSGDLNRFSAANRGTLKEYRERIKENLEGENLKVVELKYGKSPLF